MKRQILSVTIAISTVVLSAFPGLTSTVNIVALGKIDRVKYQAVKLDDSIDAMLNPEQGGVNPMPPPPPWIPPVEEEMMNKLPPSNLPGKPGYKNYTPVHLPPSAPWMTPIQNESQFMNIPSPIR